MLELWEIPNFLANSLMGIPLNRSEAPVGFPKNYTSAKVSRKLLKNQKRAVAIKVKPFLGLSTIEGKGRDWKGLEGTGSEGGGKGTKDKGRMIPIA